ncbi:MAG: hypothetical protein WCJ93_09030 [Methanomicrobiales archaeon]
MLYYKDKIETVLIKAYRVTNEIFDALQTELKPLHPVTKAGHTAQETFKTASKSQEKSFNLGDFGIREFNQNDDWLFMKPGKRE